MMWLYPSIVGLLLLIIFMSACAKDDLMARIASLRQRIKELEAEILRLKRGE